MTAGAFEILCGCLTILLLLYYYLTVNFNHWKSRGVNGPTPIPFFGNVADNYFNRACLGDVLKKIYDTYQNETMVGIFLGGNPVLLLRDPKYIMHVLIKDFSYFVDRHVGVNEKADPLSLHLFKIDAARWRPLRTRLSPVFTSGKLKDMFHLLLECSEHFERYLIGKVPKDGIIECRELTAKFTINVIGSCAFGLDMNALNDEQNEFHKIGRRIFRSDMKVLIRTTLRDSLPWLYDRIGHLINDDDVSDFMTNICRETIEYRKRNNVHRNDFIDAIIDLKDHPEKLNLDSVSDIYVASQLHVFFAAGFETSSTTMSNALYELAQDLSIQEKMREEIKEVLDVTNGVITYESIKEMVYLDKVFRETLRKYPPVMFLGRKATSSYTFQETKVTIPKGQSVYIPVSAIHFDPNIYPNPHVFDPERFSDENVKLRDPMHYLPFGNGPRNCIGARFAAYQTKVGLIKMLMNYKIDVCEKTQIPYIPNPKQRMMLQPKHGIHVKLIKLDS